MTSDKKNHRESNLATRHNMVRTMVSHTLGTASLCRNAWQSHSQIVWQKMAYSVAREGPRPDPHEFLYLESQEKCRIRRCPYSKWWRIETINNKYGKANQNTLTRVVVKREYRKRMRNSVRNGSGHFEH